LIRSWFVHTLPSRSIFSVANIVFLVGGVYFAALVALGQSSLYSIVPAILCFISFGLALRSDLFFSAPFRLGTTIFVLVLLVAQEFSAFSSSFINLFITATILINGCLFFLYFGCALSVIREIAKVKSEEGEEEEEVAKPRAVSKPSRQV
jgi:hypothetical protein